MGEYAMTTEIVPIISQLFPMIAVIVSVAIGGWVFTTWLRIKNGYPLDGAWGQAVYPKTSDEAMERIKLLSSENAQLRAELGSIKDRLATVERIVTDDGHRLTQEIEALRVPRN
jgi:predicted metal-binding membrane protein